MRPPRRPSRLALTALVAATIAGPGRAFDGTFLPLEGGTWDLSTGPIEYMLEPDGSGDIDDGSDLQAVRDAFRAWACVEGTSLRFVEGAGPGPAVMDTTDGKNTVFWDEGGDLCLMTEVVLGVTLGDADGTVRTAADICFNGVHHTWSTDDIPSANDVGSIAAHEIGHFIGLDHPCDPGEVACNGPERSVMTPVWGGEVQRAPLPDDEDGARSLYPAGPLDESGCEGPGRRGESCTCNDECVEGLVCAGRIGARVCSARCAADSPECGGPDWACVLSTPDGDEPAPGVCIKAAETERPAAALCVADRDCEEGLSCELFDVVERSICTRTCENEADCAGDRCVEGVCVLPGLGVKCEEPDVAGCGCSAASGTDFGAAALVVLVSVRARRRRALRR